MKQQQYAIGKYTIRTFIDSPRYGCQICDMSPENNEYQGIKSEITHSGEDIGVGLCLDCTAKYKLNSYIKGERERGIALIKMKGYLK